MKNAPVIAKKKKGWVIKPAIKLTRPEAKVLKKGEYISPNCLTEPGNPDSPSYMIQLPYYGDGSPEEYLTWRDLLKKALTGQNITDGPGMFSYTENVMTGDALAFFKRKTLEAPARTAVRYNIVMKELTAHVFPVHAYREQKRYMRRFLRKPQEMTTREYFTRVQEINNHLTLFPTESEDEVATAMSQDELVETLYHALPNSWMTNMVLQGLNYAQHSLTELLQTCERFESVEEPAPEKPSKDSKSSSSSKKRKQITFENSDEESSSSRKYCLIHGLCTHNTNDCTDMQNFANLKKKKKKEARAAVAAEKTKFRRTPRRNRPRRTGSSQYKDYVPREEVNSLVVKSIKKLLKKQKKNAEEVHAISKFADMSISSSESEKDELKSLSSHELSESE